MITHASQMHRLLYDRPRYEDLCAGELPTGYKRKNVPWEKIKALKNAMHKIVFAPEAEHFYLTCPANPFKLVCIGCKTFCRCACCPHVLAMTHMLEGEKPESERNGGLDLLKVMRTLNRPPSGGGAPDDAGEEGERGRYFRRRKARKAWTSQKGTTSKGKGVGGPGKRVVGGVGMGAGVKKKGKGTSKGAPRGGGRGGGKGGAEHRGVGGVGVVRGGLGPPPPSPSASQQQPVQGPYQPPPRNSAGNTAPGNTTPGNTTPAAASPRTLACKRRKGGVVSSDQQPASKRGPYWRGDAADDKDELNVVMQMAADFAKQQGGGGRRRLWDLPPLQAIPGAAGGVGRE